MMMHRVFSCRVSSFNRHLKIGWLATVVSATHQHPAGSWMGFSSSSAGNSGHHDGALGVLRRLSKSFSEPQHPRAPQVAKTATKESASPAGNSERGQRTELASEFCALYPTLPPLSLPISHSCERGNSILFLAINCSPIDDDVQIAVESFQKGLAIDDDDHDYMLSTRLHSASLTNLRRATTPAFEDILEYIFKQNTVKGMQFLISLRTDLQQMICWMKTTSSDDDRLPRLKDLDNFLHRLLSIWFSPGIIELRRITYETTAASIIEAIAKKEAVHPMRSLTDLRSRLGAGRRVFSLFHPVLPDKPLVFVHAALLNEVPSEMSHVMEVTPNSQPVVATFYSISNGTPGLVGVGLGEFLLKESIQRLQIEFPSLKTFVTLSPIPGFRNWLEDKIRNNREGGHFYDDSIISKKDLLILSESGLSSKEGPWNSLLTNLQELDDYGDPGLRKVLMKLACRYLLVEKHRGRPLDSVTRFHVGNGAVVHRINFGADLTRKGVKNSFGIMVNYRYDLDRVSDNQKHYEAEYKVHWDEAMEEWMSYPHSRL